MYEEFKTSKGSIRVVDSIGVGLSRDICRPPRAIGGSPCALLYIVKLCGNAQGGAFLRRTCCANNGVMVAQTSRSAAMDRYSTSTCVPASRCTGASHLRLPKKRWPRRRRTGWPPDPAVWGNRTVVSHRALLHPTARETHVLGSRCARRPAWTDHPHHVVATASSHGGTPVAFHRSRIHAAGRLASVGHVSAPVGYQCASRRVMLL